MPVGHEWLDPDIVVSVSRWDSLKLVQSHNLFCLAGETVHAQIKLAPSGERVQGILFCKHSAEAGFGQLRCVSARHPLGVYLVWPLDCACLTQIGILRESAVSLH